MFSRSPFLCGDSLSLMECMDNDCYHAVVTDPPYASGGLTTAERKASPARKYLSSSRYLSFDNDTRDQSTHFLWSVMWMQEAIRITRHGGWLMVFSDWRQLPLTSDALQVAGWTWRAVVTWDKTEACRPHQGMFRNQSEFILIATRGSIGKEQDRPRVFPAGVFRHYLKPSDKMHLTGKPVPLMRHLMTVLPPGSRVLDPFMGSGTTLVAARDLGHVAHGIDLSPVYSDCGILLFGDTQDAHAGGSGCGCSAAVLCGPLLRDMHEGKIRRMIFAGTGAMMSPTSVQQSQPIAGICHAVVLERSDA